VISVNDLGTKELDEYDTSAMKFIEKCNKTVEIRFNLNGIQVDAERLLIV
jgi:hypothetical protein